ncbi:TPA: hypothetical protein N0F65_010820 [Lagenidium giganteum]|uniref:Peptidase M13 C-terminal domain-containing protein n=1 Tax=Lagenidium giganteum TaxID=4803 RepID=A0AAV2Z1L1_9STRA|nr:TPA: hypothetical protein N0F65_010820 [Lagenidium giganteum]
MFNVSYHLVRNFGAIGATIGHEIVHGYGTVGRKFDENGNSRDWWTHDDAAEFESRSQCFIDQYSSFELMDDEGKYVVNNNGERTLEENIADNGGLRLARQAYKKFAKENPELLKGFDLTEDEVEKLFFISMGQMYCSRLDAENIKMIMIDNGHSIGPDRVNGMMMNSKVFSKVFQCPKGSAMNPATKCELW